MRSHGVLLFLLGAAAAVAAPEGITLSLSPEHGVTRIVATGKPEGEKIRATAPGPQGELQVTDKGVRGRLRFALEGITTANPNLDRLMKLRFLGIHDFPQAVFQLRSVTLPSGFPASDFDREAIPFSGMMNLHGRRHSVNGKLRLKRDGRRYSAVAEFPLQFSDYGIDTPRIEGTTLVDRVEVSVTFTSGD